MKKNTLSWEECALLLSDDIMGACLEKRIEFLALVREIGFKRAYTYVARNAWLHYDFDAAGAILGKELWHQIDVTYLVYVLHQVAGEGYEGWCSYVSSRSLRAEEYLQRYPAKRIVELGQKALIHWARSNRQRKF